jgi:hypothetical protein
VPFFYVDSAILEFLDYFENCALSGNLLLACLDPSQQQAKFKTLFYCYALLIKE